jgi:protein-tyrosine phosphatase
MDSRAAATLRAAGYDPSLHRARRFDPTWFGECDLVLAMDRDNEADLIRLAGPHRDKVRMFRSYDPLGTGDVPDPYYGGPEGFDDVLTIVERTAAAIVADLRRAVPH